MIVSASNKINHRLNCIALRESKITFRDNCAEILTREYVISTRLVTKGARRAERDDDISAVILGCAGMVEVVGAVRDQLSIKVIDPVECATTCMLWMRQHILSSTCVSSKVAADRPHF